MSTRFVRIVALSMAVLPAGSVLAQPAAPPVKLKSRQFVPPAIGPGERQHAESRRAGREHLLVQFARPITRDDLNALRRHGATPLRYVPANTVAIAVPPGFDPLIVPGARWAGPLEAADKISTDTRRDMGRNGPRHPLTFVEFHPDTSAGGVSAALAAAGVAAVPTTGLPGYVALIATDPTAIERLADTDEVAWFYPAPDDAAAGVTPMCEGAVVEGATVANYAAAGEGWDGAGRGAAVLAYVLQRPSGDLSAYLQTNEIVRAMSEWSRYVDVTFRAGSGATALRSVNVVWTVGDHGDGYPFDPSILAHAFYPAPPSTEPLAGDIHFNDDLLWAAAGGSGYDVFSVALHELGHSLGLTHSSDPDAVMYPTYRGTVPGLASVDIVAIQALYAPRGSGVLPSGWTAVEIGGPMAGTSGAVDGVFTIDGSGSDVWGTRDGFRFVARTLDGDGDIVARVEAIDGTHRWTKAGVMIRGSDAAGAPHGFMLVSKSRGLAFQRRLVSGGVSYSTEAGTGTAPQWVWVSRRGTRIAAYTAQDGGAWRFVGADTIALGASARAGLAVTSHDPSVVATAIFSHVSVTRVVRPAWVSADIGAVGLSGSWSISGKTIRVTGAGDDIWNTADEFRFVWTTMTGDGEIVARVASIQNVRSWSKAGVMLRDSTDPAAPHAFMLASAAKGYAFQRRVDPGGLSTSTSGGAGAPPGWVKLVRRGNVFTAYRSDDGVNWVFVESDAIGMGSTVLAGLAVSSHLSTARCTAVFDSVEIRQ